MNETTSQRHELAEQRGMLQVIVVLQLAIMVGIVIVFLQFGSLPDEVAAQVPTDTSDAAILPTIESKIDSLSAKLNAIQSSLDAQATPVPTASAAP
jgi:hypothetical protein